MKRNIAVTIILSIITCGIYALYWMAKLNDEINTLSGHPNDTSGGMVILLSIVTCGIYELYWFYKMGCKVDEIKTQQGAPAQYSGIIYLVVSLIGFSIVNMCLMQDTVNKAVDQNAGI